VWADIDLDALAHNLGVIRRRVGEGVEVMLVAKADAYGHGAVAVAHHAVRCGVASIGVGTAEEALELRRAGVRVPIVVLGTIVDEEVVPALLHDVEIGIHSSDRCRMIQRTGRKLGRTARVHLNVDTGMGRLGVLPERALDLLRRISDSSHLSLAGVMTHVTAPEGALAPSTSLQTARFERVLEGARREGLLAGAVHVANSACIFTGLDPMGDVVRPGISAYGILPPELPGSSELEAVMSLRSQIVFLKDVPRGTTIGYGNTWCAPRRTRLATLPLGYNDGVDWRLSNRGEALVRGCRAPIVGRVSMDYTTLDVTHIRGVRGGDTATLIGRDGDERIRVEDVAVAADTIPYEITCSIGRRVARVYRGGEHTSTPSRARSSSAGRS
jgi:alanine racemase